MGLNIIGTNCPFHLKEMTTMISAAIEFNVTKRDIGGVKFTTGKVQNFKLVFSAIKHDK